MGPRAMLTAATVLALAGCGLLGTASEQDPEWAQDPGSGKFYRPGIIMQSTELLEEHFPELDGVQDAALTEGRFTDPAERVPIPAPDDYWWQAAVTLGPEEAGRLADARTEADASDGGGSVPGPGGLTDAEVRAILVPTIEQAVSACPSGWIPVGDLLVPDGYSDRTAAGDMIQLAALCAETDELVIAANDM